MHPRTIIKQDPRFPDTPAKFAVECLEELKQFEELSNKFKHLRVFAGSIASLAQHMVRDMHYRYFVDDAGVAVTHRITPEMHRLFGYDPSYTIQGLKAAHLAGYYLGDLI